MLCIIVWIWSAPFTKASVLITWFLGAKELAQQLRVLALKEDLGSLPRSYIVVHNSATPVSEYAVLSSASAGTKSTLVA